MKIFWQHIGSRVERQDKEHNRLQYIAVLFDGEHVTWGDIVWRECREEIIKGKACWMGYGDAFHDYGFTVLAYPEIEFKAIDDSDRKNANF